MEKAKLKVTTERNNNINIIGDNVLYNNGIITAYYLVPLENYTTSSNGNIEANIDKLVNVISNLTMTNPNLLFTVEKLEKIVRAKDVINNLYDTIHLYREDFEMPIEFTKNIQNDLQSFCLLGIDIQQTNMADLEGQSFKDTLKEASKVATNFLIGLGNMKCDPELILRIENNLYRTVKDYCARCTPELVFYNYVSKLFPNYTISYDKIGYINENSFEAIMSSVHQTISDGFGWFEMHNEGVEIFNQPSETTYGCMLDINAFPTVIENTCFPIGIYGRVVTTVKCLKKEDAERKFKRRRSEDEYEVQKALEAGENAEIADKIGENISIATRALRELGEGEIMCQFNTSILVYSKSQEKLKDYVMEIINDAKSRDILVVRSLNQATDFLNIYVNKKPKALRHLSSIRFPLSFQQNAGATVGDFLDDSAKKIWSPSIGEDVQ